MKQVSSNYFLHYNNPFFSYYSDKKVMSSILGPLSCHCWALGQVFNPQLPSCIYEIQVEVQASLDKGI